MELFNKTSYILGRNFQAQKTNKNHSEKIYFNLGKETF